MGNSVSSAVKAAQAATDAAAAQVKADIENLAVILRAKQEEYFTRLVNNKGEDKTIPIKTLLEYKKHMSVDCSSEPSKQLNTALNEMFGGNFLGSLKAMALGAIDAVLGDVSGGEKEEVGYKVLLMYNTIVRVDYYVWGYYMKTSSGTIDQAKKGLVFVATVGVVDMKTVGLESLVYVVGAQATNALAFMQSRGDLWNERLELLTTTTVDKATKKSWLASLSSENADNEDDLKADDFDSDEVKATASLKTQLQDLVKSYKNEYGQINEEQLDIMDQITRVYSKARGVSAALEGIGAPSIDFSNGGGNRRR